MFQHISVTLHIFLCRSMRCKRSSKRSEKPTCFSVTPWSDATRLLPQYASPAETGSNCRESEGHHYSRRPSSPRQDRLDGGSGHDCASDGNPPRSCSKEAFFCS